MRVFITGGSGLVGSRLVARLLQRGDTPVVLTRSPEAARATLGADIEIIQGDPTHRGDWERAVGTCTAAVHLAGENIFARRWNDEFKARLRDSRIESTKNVVAALAAASPKPKVLVSASAVGYYGFHGDEELTEADPPGEDFLARTAIEWEAAARPVEAAGVRLAIVRIGVVMATSGGALAQMLTPFKMGVGGPVGSGRHWMSWIHIDDLVGIMLHAIDHADMSGVVNGVSPEPVTNKQFSRALGHVLGRPSLLPVPVFALRLRFGEVADVISKGQRVLPKRTLEFGYQYRFPTIDAALTDLVGRS
jgi:hypothetical protein